jgi:hypothetical protein
MSPSTFTQNTGIAAPMDATNGNNKNTQRGKKRTGKNKAGQGGAATLFVDNGLKAPLVVVDKAFLEETRTVRPELNDYGVKKVLVITDTDTTSPTTPKKSSVAPTPTVTPTKPSNSSSAATAKKDEWTTATSKNAKKQGAGKQTTTDFASIGLLSMAARHQPKQDEVSQKPSTAPTSTPTKLDGAMRKARKEDSDGYYMAPAKKAAATPAAAEPEPDVSSHEMTEPEPEPETVAAAPASGRKKPTRSQREKMRKDKAKEKAKKEALSKKK